MTDRDFWEQIYRRFEPEKPPSDPSWRVARRYSPAGKILADLRRPFGAKRYLVYGTVGSGKTTELLWLSRERARDSFVIFVDLYAHFQEKLGDPDALQNVQPWEVSFLIGLSVYAAGVSIFGHRWQKADQEALRQAAQRFLDGSEGAAPRIDIAKLASTVAALAAAPAAALAGPLGGAAAAIGGTLTAVGAGLEAGSWDIPLGLPGRRAVHDQEERAQQLINAVNRLIGVLQADYRQLTVVVDGLDRISNLDTVQELFIASSLLGSLECATVVTAPLSLRHQGYASRVRGFEPQPLANLPVLDQDAPGREGDGIEACIEVWRRRTEDLDPDQRRFPDPLLRQIAYYSGGRMRDLIRLIRITAEQAWDRSLAQVDQQAAEEAIDERRRVVEEGIHQGHLALLRSVMNDPQRALPGDDEVVELLDNFWLLPYPNKSTWWFPHPLLTLNLLPI